MKTKKTTEAVVPEVEVTAAPAAQAKLLFKKAMKIVIGTAAAAIIAATAVILAVIAVIFSVGAKTGANNAVVAVQTVEQARVAEAARMSAELGRVTEAAKAVEQARVAEAARAAETVEQARVAEAARAAEAEEAAKVAEAKPKSNSFLAFIKKKLD
jgi:fused signal recognition particle receptor